MWNDEELEALDHKSLASAIRGDRVAAVSIFESHFKHMKDKIPGLSLDAWLWAVATVTSRTYARVCPALPCPCTTSFPKQS